MNNDLYARAAAVINAKHNKTAERRRNAIDTAIRVMDADPYGGLILCG